MGQGLSFGLGAATSGISRLRPVVQNLQAGMAGGAGTAQFIAVQSLLNNFYDWLGEVGDAAGIWTTDANGNPVAFDDLRGKHPGPGGQNMHWSNSLLVFEPGSSTAKRAS